MKTEYVMVDRDLLEDPCESLAAEIDARCPDTSRIYVSIERKYQRDMEPVNKVRELLTAPKSDAEPVSVTGQLPEGMEHCTIEFKECNLGHGWLTATNWVQHGCPTCESNVLRETIKAMTAQPPAVAVQGDAISNLIAEAKKRMCSGGAWADCWTSDVCCMQSLVDAITAAERAVKSHPEQPAPVPTSERLPMLYRIKSRSLDWRSELVLTVNALGQTSYERLIASGLYNSDVPYNIRWNISATMEGERNIIAWVGQPKMPRPMTHEMIWDKKTIDFGPVYMSEVEWLKANGCIVETYEPSQHLTHPQSPEAE